MVKLPKNPQGITNTSQNSPNQTLKLDSELSKKKDKSISPKSKQQINKDYYQKHKEIRQKQRREKYQQQKLQVQQTENEQSSKYYGAEAFKVLISFKEYTELNQKKRKKWLNFAWIFRELADRSDIEVKRIAVSDIIQVMKLREEAENLINDYWETARNEIIKGKKSWDTLDQEQKDRLIKYWGYEKVRKENNLLTTAEQLKQQGQEYLKEIELAKFHEERGKVKCPCYACEQRKKIQGEIKQKWKKELEDYDRKSGISDKEECPSCGKLKALDEEVGVCNKCKENYE